MTEDQAYTTANYRWYAVRDVDNPLRVVGFVRALAGSIPREQVNFVDADGAVHGIKLEELVNVRGNVFDTEASFNTSTSMSVWRTIPEFVELPHR